MSYTNCEKKKETYFQITNSESEFMSRVTIMGTDKISERNILVIENMGKSARRDLIFLQSAKLATIF